MSLLHLEYPAVWGRMKRLFLSHPPLEERIQALLEAR